MSTVEGYANHGFVINSLIVYNSLQLTGGTVGSWPFGKGTISYGTVTPSPRPLFKTWRHL